MWQRKLIGQESRENETQKNRINESRQKIIKMMTIILFMFFISYFPIHTYRIYKFILNRCEVGAKKKPKYSYGETLFYFFFKT